MVSAKQVPQRLFGRDSAGRCLVHPARRLERRNTSESRSQTEGREARAQIAAEESGGEAVSAKRKDEPDIEPPATSRLRLIKTPERKPPEQSPEVKTMLDGMRRRESGRHGQPGRNP